MMMTNDEIDGLTISSDWTATRRGVDGQVGVVGLKATHRVVVGH